jgi:hypothetical protein
VPRVLVRLSRARRPPLVPLPPQTLPTSAMVLPWSLLVCLPPSSNTSITGYKCLTHTTYVWLGRNGVGIVAYPPRTSPNWFLFFLFLCQCRVQHLLDAL